ncbi:hypothetical protein Ahy_A03g015880 [Arachis hypogaea]|uniref:Protein FAR1-RELATED SEQUENCE n=1 Tax=Arachis hypogaea TaxID=3818 RepID=A0A445E1X4_ARAHY|nr:hypothetical protein Ahy_A03g015880 [Arachis hypogaea]
MNSTAGLNYPARIYIHTLKDVGGWIISKVVLHNSHPCCPTQAKILKQHRELSMSTKKTYQSFVAATGGHRELNFIEKDVRNYFMRKVRNRRIKISFLSSNSRTISRLSLLFGPTQGAGLPLSISEMYNLVCGSFVGVNHHGQSTPLGCSLMKNEDIESFK